MPTYSQMNAIAKSNASKSKVRKGYSNEEIVESAKRMVNEITELLEWASDLGDFNRDCLREARRSLRELIDND